MKFSTKNLTKNSEALLSNSAFVLLIVLLVGAVIYLDVSIKMPSNKSNTLKTPSGHTEQEHEHQYEHEHQR